MYQSQDQREFARRLRSDATEAETHLWGALRKRQLQGFRFRRQYAIGRFIADFECHERGLIVELDGGQHNTEENQKRDRNRSEYLRQHGYRVLRFWNHDVLNNTDSVLEAIANALLEPAPGRPHPDPPPKGEGV